MRDGYFGGREREAGFEFYLVLLGDFSVVVVLVGLLFSENIK